jgi:tRNA A-37 threonylcarbamoyl transferase component Bud32
VNFGTDTTRAREEALLLASLTRLEPDRWLRRMPGRETLLARLPGIHEGRRVVVKRFESRAGREGWIERIRGRRPRSEARREFDNLAELHTVGVPVPAPLRVCENEAASSLWPLAARGRSAVVMECVEHREDARVALERRTPGERRALAAQLLEIVRRFHGRGWIHRDLYLQHFLLPLDAQRGPVLIDVARARWSSRHLRRWLVKDLAALHLSAPTCVSRCERLRFLRGWLGGQGQREALRWKRWAREIDRKARRLGAHQPRHEDHEQRIGVEPEVLHG